MSNDKRKFLGIWIPAEIYLNNNLSWIEKLLYCEIESFQEYGDGCFASNKYFSKWFNVSENYISKCIAKLKKEGVIYQKSFNGRSRLLFTQSKADYDKSISLAQKYKADYDKSIRQTNTFVQKKTVIDVDIDNVNNPPIIPSINSFKKEQEEISEAVFLKKNTSPIVLDFFKFYIQGLSEKTGKDYSKLSYETNKSYFNKIYKTIEKMKSKDVEMNEACRLVAISVVEYYSNKGDSAKMNIANLKNHANNLARIIEETRINKS